MIQRMFVTIDTKKTSYKNVGKINHGDDLILELTVLSDGDMISFNNPMVDLLVKKSDGKMIRQNSGIEHIRPNKFIIEVSKDCVTSPGLSTNQLIINDNGRISTCMFYYTILSSLEEDIIESVSNVEVLEQLDEFTIQMKDKMENFDNELQNRMSGLEDAIDDLVESFGATSVELQEAELSRNEAEQTRAQAESVRVQNESRRLQNDLNLANAEAERVRAENVRIQNEADRALVDEAMDQKESEREDSELERIQNESKRATNESVRQQNENTRQSNESIRMSNETDRKTQENRRVTAETNRVNAETTRRNKENSRISNEIDRKTQENRRVTAETNRVNAETTRHNNENSRISNEIERQKAMNEMKSLIDEANGFDERVGVVENEIVEINSSLDNMGKELENKKYTEINLIDFSEYANIGTDTEDWSLAFDEALKTLKGQFGIIKVSKILKIKKPLILPYGVDIEGTSLPNSGFICDLNFDGDFMIKQESDYSHVSIKKLFLNFPTGKKIGGVYLKHPYDYTCIEKIVGNNSNGDFIVVGCEKISQTLRISDCLVTACNSLTEPLVRLDNLQEAYICNNKFLGQQNSKADCDLVVCDGVTTSMFINNSFASTNNCGLILKAEKYGKRINANKIIGNLFELCGETVIKLTGYNTNTGEAEYNLFIGNDTLYKHGKIELSNCSNTTVLDRLQVLNSNGARRTFNIAPYNPSATDAYSNTSLLSDKGGLKGKFIGDFYFDKGRTNTSSIQWDASTTADYGLKFIIDGKTKVKFMGNNIINEVNSGGITLKDANGKYWVLRIDTNGAIKITDY